MKLVFFASFSLFFSLFFSLSRSLIFLQYEIKLREFVELFSLKRDTCAKNIDLHGGKMFFGGDARPLALFPKLHFARCDTRANVQKRICNENLHILSRNMFGHEISISVYVDCHVFVADIIPLRSRDITG